MNQEQSVNEGQNLAGGSSKSPRPALEQLSDEQLREAEQNIAAQKREREYAKWDAEIVGRHFRIIRGGDAKWWQGLVPFQGDDYVTLEESLAVGSKRDFVFADVVYLHIQRRNDGQLVCSGFEVSHERREEPYLKIQPVFYSYGDFRHYLNSWRGNTGPAKHVDEISKEEYQAALDKVISAVRSRIQ